MAPDALGGDGEVSAATDPGVVASPPVDPDVDPPIEVARRRRWLHRRRRTRRRHLDVVLAVAAGGALGTVVRYSLERAFPAELDRFPWTTFGINLVGCLLLGVVLYVVFERRPPSRLLRPFLAIGVLGGFTTFSTFAVEVVQRMPDHPRTAIAYLAASVAGGPLAVLAGSAIVRRIYATPRVARGRSSR